MSLDLTRFPLLRRIVKSPLFPAVLQWVTLACFVLLILLGWNYHDIRGIDAEAPLAYTNVNTLFFWVIWLMGLILLVPLIGRLWCTLCPLGYVNDLLARVGLRRRYPRRLKNLYLAALLLLFYNGVVALLGINRYPDYSARLLLAVTLLLVAVALLFRGRIFCGYLCPVGAMVGVYSRVSPWRLEARDREVCRTCENKDCYQGTERWFRLRTPLGTAAFPFRRPGCQVDLFPPELSEDPRCVMCTQCIKNCPHDNITWGTRPFLKGVTAPSAPDLSEGVFLAVLIGATAAIFTRVWPRLNAGIGLPADALSAFLGLGGAAAGMAQLLWRYALLPLTLSAGLACLAWLLSRSSLEPLPGPPEGGASLAFGLPERDRAAAAERTSWHRRRLTPAGLFSAFTLSFVPTVLSGHAAFALVKVNEKIGYLPGALADPTGVKFYLAIHRLGMMAAPGEILPLVVVRWLALLLVVAGGLASLWAVRSLARHFYPDEPSFRLRGGTVYGVANLALAGLLVALVVTWLF